MSMKRVSVTLTEDEYQALAAEAARERRTVSQQAAYRITRPAGLTIATTDTPPSIKPWPPIFGGSFAVPPPSGSTFI